MANTCPSALQKILESKRESGKWFTVKLRALAVAPRQSYWCVSLGGKLSSGTANYESGFYMTPGPRIDQPRLQRTAWGQLYVCRMTKTEGHRGSDFSVLE